MHVTAHSFVVIVMMVLARTAAGADGWSGLDQALADNASAWTSHQTVLSGERSRLIPPQVPAWFKAGKPVIQKVLARADLTPKDVLWVLSLTRPGDTRLVDADWMQAEGLIRLASIPRSPANEKHSLGLGEALTSLGAHGTVGPLAEAAAAKLLPFLAPNDLPARMAFLRAFPAVAIRHPGAWDDLLESDFSQSPKVLTSQALEILTYANPSPPVSRQATERLVAQVIEPMPSPSTMDTDNLLAGAVTNPYVCQGHLTDAQADSLLAAFPKATPERRAVIAHLLLADGDRARLERNLMASFPALLELPPGNLGKPVPGASRVPPLLVPMAALACLQTTLLTPEVHRRVTEALTAVAKSPSLTPPSITLRASLTSLAWRTATNPVESLRSVTWLSEPNRPMMPTETSYVQEFVIPAIGRHDTLPPEGSARGDFPVSVAISLLNLYPSWEPGLAKVITGPIPRDEQVTWSFLRLVAHHPSLAETISPKTITEIADSTAQFPTFGRRCHVAIRVLNDVVKDRRSAVDLLIKAHRLKKIDVWSESFSLALKIDRTHDIVQEMRRQLSDDQDPGAQVMLWLLDLWSGTASPFPEQAYANLGRSVRLLEVANALYGSQHLLKSHIAQLRDPRALYGAIGAGRPLSDTISREFPDKQAWILLNFLTALDAIEWKAP